MGAFDLSTVWPKDVSAHSLFYLLSCLALGVVLGSGVGAALAPQLLLAADDAGVYDFIRQNAAMMHARARPAPRPLPQLMLRAGRRASVMQARLFPGYSPNRRHISGQHALGVATPEPEIGPKCGNCGAARSGSPIEAILNDKTLRAGDTVMMSYGAMVYLGGKQLPHSLADFSDFRETRLLTKKERELIDADLGLTMRAEAMRSFDSKPAAKATSNVAKASGMRAYFPVTQTLR